MQLRRDIFLLEQKLEEEQENKQWDSFVQGLEEAGLTGCDVLSCDGLMMI